LKINKLSELIGVKDYNISIILRTILQVCDGQLTFGDNVQGKIMRGVLIPFANTDFPIQHDLNRTVTDFIVLKKNAFADFKAGETTPTNTRLYLQSDTANVTIDILILG